MCAVLLTTDAEDLIVHARSGSVHRQQFVLQALAHMILGHEIDDDSDGPDFLLPDIPAVVLQRPRAHRGTARARSAR
ncbi:hypothetical protein D6T64_13570 [Cryobacterium melibiosiphilum]|uniref:Uncharacterized protein n=1 Tax=Cryobacterium melibiosiphilum TaxID=995039 RepID=A0A3A5MI99_9MICO|nr:hypothetical protein D6T64_13570 [Cryobacterium melibiosiphilum]